LRAEVNSSAWFDPKSRQGFVTIPVSPFWLTSTPWFLRWAMSFTLVAAESVSSHREVPLARAEVTPLIEVNDSTLFETFSAAS